MIPYEKKYNLNNGTVLPFLQYPLLDEIPFIRHCCTTRQGGASDGIFTSLNLSFSRGDDETAVLENYRRVAEALGTDVYHIVTTDQTHTTNVRVASEEDAGCGVIKSRAYTDVDGLVTDIPGLALAAFAADCVPVYFVDSKRKAIGISHSGWRGTVGRIGQVTIETMMREYGTDPADLICAIGPSICQRCYEVSEDVADAFTREFAGHESEILISKGSGKYRLDLWKANEIVLKDAGVLPDHIQVTQRCTCCESEYLFSHRASKGRRGNMGAFLMIRDDA